MRNIIKTHAAVTVIFLCISLFPSCQYNPVHPEESEEIFFELPQWPPESYKYIESPYPALSRWKINVTCAEYQETFFTTEQLIGFTIKKNEPFCISATPITLTTDGKETCFFMPAGTIYPYDWNESLTQTLTWEDGYASFIFETLFNSKKGTGVTTEHMTSFLKRFNWIKLKKAINEKNYNPWLLDTYQLLDNLSYGTFKPSFLNLKNVYSLPLAKLEPYNCENLLCSYIPENKNLRETGEISVKKGRLQILSCNTDFAVIILYSSSKNVSLDYVFMPIFIEEI